MCACGTGCCRSTTDSYVHYEASAFSKLSCFEIALHFERRGRERNDALMKQFMPYAFEIKAELGPHIEFERWDKVGRVYETLPLATLDDEYGARGRPHGPHDRLSGADSQGSVLRRSVYSA